MPQGSLENYGAYQKGMRLFDLVAEDMAKVRKNPLCYKLVTQQMSAADSICADIEEGHGRGTSREYARFLWISRGSAREVRGRYIRMRHWLDHRLVDNRLSLTDEIIGILTSTINRLDDRRGPR